jgi:hypothetical protein
MATVLVGHFMMDALKELGDTDELSCGETLCQEVIARYEDEARPLIHELKKVKDELVEIWRKQNKPLSLLSEAIDEAGSPERQQQVEFLWRQQLPDLHIHIPRSEKASWFRWANSIETNESFLCSALSFPAAKPLIQQLVTLESGLDTPNTVQKTYNDAANRLSDGKKVSPEVSERARARVMVRWASAPTNIQETEVQIWSNGRVNLTWKAPSGEIKRINITGARTWIPKTVGTKRYVQFTPEGMSILDEQKAVMSFPRLYPRQERNWSVTWTKADISRLPQAVDLVECWKYHLPGEVWDEEADEGAEILPKPFPPGIPKKRLIKAEKDEPTSEEPQTKKPRKSRKSKDKTAVAVAETPLLAVQSPTVTPAENPLERETVLLSLMKENDGVLELTPRLDLLYAAHVDKSFPNAQRLVATRLLTRSIDDLDERNQIVRILLQTDAAADTKRYKSLVALPEIDPVTNGKVLELRDQLQREAGSNAPVLVSDLPRQQTPRQSSPATAREAGRKRITKSKAVQLPLSVRLLRSPIKRLPPPPPLTRHPPR